MSRGNKTPLFGIETVSEKLSEEPKIFTVHEPARQALGRREFLRWGAAVPAGSALAAFLADRASAAGNIIRAHRGAVTLLLVSTDGALLVSGSAMDDLKKWSLPDGAQGQIASVGSSGVWSLFPNGLLLGRGKDSVVSTNSFPQCARLSSLTIAGSSGVRAITAAADGKSLFVTDGADTIKLSVEPSGQIQEMKRVADDSSQISYLATNGSVLVLAGRDGSLSTRNVADLALLGQFHLPSAIVCVLSLQRQPTVVTAHDDGTINVVSIADGKAIALAKSPPPIVALASHSGGDSVAVASRDGQVENISLLTGDRTAFANINLQARETLTVAAMIPARDLGAGFSPEMIAIGTSSGQIVLLDWPSLRTRSCLFDKRDTEPASEGISFRVLDPNTGRTVTYTLPCGSPIPTGATCICNCVTGTAAEPPNAPPPTYPLPTSHTVTVPGQTITQPCTPSVPAGYICQCNCIPGR